MQACVAPLIQALKDENSDVRRTAAWTLGKIGDARAVEPLSQALKDENSDVRMVVTWSLNKIKADIEIKRKGYGIRPL